MDSRDLPLGRAVADPERYWPEVLTAIPRSKGRADLKSVNVQMLGWDRWFAWEFAWQQAGEGLQVGILEIRVPAESSHIFESKSLKLYLNSCFYRRFANREAMLAEVRQRLSTSCAQEVEISYHGLESEADQLQVKKSTGTSLDHLAGKAGWKGKFELESRTNAERKLYRTDLFRSLCPVTGQPDWASVFVEVQGVQPRPSNLLGYLLSYADHQAFHESCVERIFTEIWQHCAPEALAITARFTRRGGIEINPYRTSPPELGEQNLRLLRQ